MTTEYALKDVEMQLALEKLFPGFGRALADANFGRTELRLARLYLTPRGGDEQWELTVPEQDVTIRNAYEPGVWNEPDAIPPEGVPMCVELTDEFSHVFRRVGTFNRGEWSIVDFPSDRAVEVKRYRSWE